jgi:class 3 adenylate cyclase/tetratricopeptide (TPR) repeat protein
MQQVADWLEKLGLGQYAQRFAENGINTAALPHLTDQDLKDIGVLLGHRRIMLAALGELVPGATTAERSVAVAPLPQDTAERRQVTVMFSDLVGSTALSARMDPEDLREVISGYQKCVAETVQRFGGFVAKYMGDGGLVYFGYPQASEDDAEQAVRAGLVLIEAVGALKSAVSLQTRVGIATGLVVVGDLIGSGEAQERAIVGETPNLASRLQGLATPASVVIAASTRQQIGHLFELEDLGPKVLAGLAEPQRAWRVLGDSGEVSRFAALRSERSALVGRDEEVELLMRRWKQAKTGEGRVVLISGEAGIGKSRLTTWLSEHIRGESHTRMRYFCAPHYQDSALYPFIVQLERAAGFARDDTAETKLGKLQALLVPSMWDDGDVSLLRELLSLPSSTTDLNLSPQRKRQKLFEALLKLLEAESQQRPVLIIFEDAHWIDPTSRELLDLTVERARRLPVLLVITFRFEFQSPWSGRFHVTTLALNRLGERDGAVLAQELAGNALTADIVTEIVERTDGVPLFVEELTKSVLESIGHGERVTSLAALAVPATLQASLTARLDRLGPAAKAIAQMAAVLGREFGYDLIEPVAQVAPSELRAALAQLSDAGLLFCRGTPPNSSYLFKHALLLDGAYGMLLRGRRQELHARVAAVLEQEFPDLVERQPGLLAHHLTAAGETERAVNQWLIAGRHAATRLAHLEAISHFERGLTTLAALPENPVRDALEIELQLARGLSLFTAHGFKATDAGNVYGRARELAERRGDSHQLFMAVYGLWQTAVGTGKIFDCRRLSNRLQQLTADGHNDELRLQAHHSVWTTCLSAGMPAEARDHSEAGRRIYDPERHRVHRELYGGHDPGVCACHIGAQVSWLLGYPERSIALGQEALVLAENIAHPFSLALTLQYNSMLQLELGEPEVALQRLQRAEALAAEQRLGFVLEPQLLRGAALSLQGALEEAATCLREELGDRTAAMRLRCFGLATLSDTLIRQSEYDAALATVEEALNTEEETGNRQWDAELHRLRGVALSALNRLEEGQAALKDAFVIARRQQAKSYELRAAISMARLWRDQGKRDEARNLLAPVYGWFTEGFETRDLKEAKALLDELTT